MVHPCVVGRNQTKFFWIRLFYFVWRNQDGLLDVHVWTCWSNRRAQGRWRVILVAFVRVYTHHVVPHPHSIHPRYRRRSLSLSLLLLFSTKRPEQEEALYPGAHTRDHTSCVGLVVFRSYLWW